jgi:hypothetical protein
MRTRPTLAALALLFGLLAAGCTNTGTTSDNDKRGVLYGGVSAGGTRP